MTGDDMGMREWGIAYGIVKLLRGANKKGGVRDLADSIDKVIDTKFPKRSENIQSALCQELLLPLIKELLKENPILLIQMINKFKGKLDTEFKVKDNSFVEKYKHRRSIRFKSRDERDNE